MGIWNFIILNSRSKASMVDYRDPHQRLFLSTLLMKLQFHLSTFNQYQSPRFQRQEHQRSLSGSIYRKNKSRRTKEWNRKWMAAAKMWNTGDILELLVVMKRKSIGWQLMAIHLNMCFSRFNFGNLFLLQSPLW